MQQDEFQIVYEPKPAPEDVRVISNGLTDYARQQKGMDPVESFTFFVRDKDGHVLAGCNGAFIYGCIHTGSLWVAEYLRGKGIGTRLLMAAEQLAREKGCTLATLNTMDWGAISLYQRLGYRVDHVRKGYKNQSTFHFLMKELT